MPHRASVNQWIPQYRKGAASTVAIHVAVVDPLPMFQRGAEATLAAAGHRVAPLDEVLGGAGGGDRAVVLLTLLADDDWALLARIGGTGRAMVIALVDDESTATAVRALRTGARSAVLRTTTAAGLRRAVEATADGQALLPTPVALALARAEGPPAPDRPPPAGEQVDWLRRLAEGTTVAQLATDVGYSERAMFRLLRSLYRELGVRGRVQAIMLAQQQGWFGRASKQVSAPGGQARSPRVASVSSPPDRRPGR